MNPSDTTQWYATLIKPPFAPPSWIFGPVWSILYIVILISFGYVFFNAFSHKWSVKIAIPFIINLIANLSFTPIQFGLKNNFLALIDILIVLGTIIWMMRVVWPLAPLVGWAQVPYLIWVSFATILQLSITWLNR
ncbi:tryptophan-rich sensory protein [Patescibacteria group bacterium]|nr:tryptophan-rich sensory protein [Patescibacteria group bacterium]MBU1123751.1 tryptophan-rich sensory protein [Patescibacteria group bacterium]MBU1910826.1 tryptophan-rich sensory protein [Patescibacteria group bacterium]